MAFHKELPQFEIARLLQQKEDMDIFDCSEDHEGHCAFYGHKDLLSWLINHSHSRGYKHTDDDYIRLALNISRNVGHNGSELVQLVLSKLENTHAALLAKDQDNTTLLHRISSRIGCAYAYEFQDPGAKIKVFGGRPGL
jgi:hypothetical protein